jgi:hypothetical protein
LIQNNIKTIPEKSEDFCMFKRISVFFLLLGLTAIACNVQVNVGNPTPTQTITEETSASVETPTTTQSAPPVSSGLTVEKLMSGTYHAPYNDRTITLFNGSYSEGSGTMIYSVNMLNNYAFGDLNGDGINDAAIILVENMGGTGQFVSLISVYDNGGMPLQKDAVELGDRVQVNSMDISSGVIHLDMIVHAPNDPLCCPSQSQKQSYWMISGNLWLMRVSTTIGGGERMINIDTPGDWADVTNPFTVNGNVPISPFENTLGYRISLPDKTLVNESSLMVTSSGMGTPGTFTRNFDLSMAGITGNVIIQFLDLSPADGSILAMGSVIVNVH